MSYYIADVPQNCVIHRAPQQPQPQQPQQQNVIQNNNVVNNILHQRMNPAERLGVNVIYERMIQDLEQMMGPIIAPYNNREKLNAAIYWGLREIDTLQGLGHNIHNILGTENLVRRISIAAYTVCADLQGAQPFEQLPFDHQMFFMNLASYLMRYLIRQH